MWRESMSRLGYAENVGDSESYRDQKLVKKPDLAWTHVIMSSHGRQLPVAKSSTAV